MNVLFLITPLLAAPLQSATDSGVKESGRATPGISPAAPGTGRVTIMGRNVPRPTMRCYEAGQSIRYLSRHVTIHVPQGE